MVFDPSQDAWWIALTVERPAPAPPADLVARQPAAGHFEHAVLVPALELLSEQHVAGGARAVEQPDGAELRTLGEETVEQRPQRRQARAAGHDDDVLAVGRLVRPADADRAADADRRSHRQLDDRLGRGSGGADGEQQPVGLEVARHRDRRGRVIGQRDHHELARAAVGVRGVETGKLQRRRVVRLRLLGDDPRRRVGLAVVGDGLELRHVGARLRRSDDSELLAHVDADRAEGDAASAAGAARAAELVPPRRELVRQPLAVAVLGLGAEVAAGDLGEAG